ncbi:MAG TPA: TatD family deoxyribonuclease [Anaerolineae bacterium]|nr:TatD family deoxyribonuclease [Anaerolineae bacterium]
MPEIQLIDTHAHLDFPQFDDDREEVIQRALEAGVAQIITIGVDLESSRAAIALAEKYSHIYATVGMHPHDAIQLTPQVLAELQELARHPKVVAVGEMGLDFYRNLSPREAQRRAFEAQLALAREIGKPVVIHDRDAHGEVMATLRRWVADHPAQANQRPLGVLHCFSGGPEMAREAVGLGFYISLAGPVTFLNARKPVEVARQVPLENLLVETDAPFLSPHPYRGRRNEPARVRLVAQRIAEIKKLPLEELARITTANAQRVFHRKEGP